MGVGRGGREGGGEGVDLARVWGGRMARVGGWPGLLPRDVGKVGERGGGYWHWDGGLGPQAVSRIIETCVSLELCLIGGQTVNSTHATEKGHANTGLCRCDGRHHTIAKQAACGRG